MRDQFEIPNKLNKISYILMGIGALALILAAVFFLGSKDEHIQTRFWSTLLQNSIFFTLITVASLFFIGVTTLAHGGWQVAFKRVPEAISTAVPIFGGILFVVLMLIIFVAHNHHIYHWIDTLAVKKDAILNGKSGFLNVGFFTIASLIILLGWSILGRKLRTQSIKEDNAPFGDSKIYWDNIKWAALFIVFYAPTISFCAWLWLMSIDAHWFSTMFGWYVFASAFVSGMSTILLFTLYLKSLGYLEFVTEEHIHDIGKFMFAFSVFWTYLWFSQFMLIWYANFPEETIYFRQRFDGYKFFFFFNLVLNFLMPLFILIRRGAKRNYFVIAMMACIIIFGHYIDFFQMIAPGALGKHGHFGWYELTLPLFFIGLLIFIVSRSLTKAPLTPKNHPLLKESIIHHT
jgi:hypothetical protein